MLKCVHLDTSRRLEKYFCNLFGLVFTAGNLIVILEETVSGHNLI